MMLAEAKELVDETVEEKEMPSFNHSYICGEIIEQIAENKTFKVFPELTLDIDKGLTPDISVYFREKTKPNFRRDITRYSEMPILAVEIISASQNIQDLLEKAELLVKNGVKYVWTVEPFSETVFVTTENGEEIFHNQVVTSEDIQVDFKKIFG